MILTNVNHLLLEVLLFFERLTSYYSLLLFFSLFFGVVHFSFLVIFFTTMLQGKRFHEIVGLRDMEGLPSLFLLVCQLDHSLLALQTFRAILLRIHVYRKATLLQDTLFDGPIEEFGVITAFVPVSSVAVRFTLTMPFEMLLAVHKLTFSCRTMLHITLHHNASHYELRVIQVLAKLWHVALAAEDELLGRLTTGKAIEFFVVLNLAYVLEDLPAVCRPYTATNLHDLLLS